MFNNLTVKNRLFFLIGLMTLLAIFLSMGGLYGMQKANDGLQTVYLDRTIPLADLGEVQRRLLHNRTALVTSFTFPEEMLGQHKKIEENIDEIASLWDSYMATYMTPEEKALADKFVVVYKPFTDAIKRAVSMQKQGDIEEGKNFYFETVRSAYKPVSEAIDALIDLQKEVAKQEYEAAQSRFHLMLITSIASLILGLALAITLGFKIVKRLVGELGGEPSYAASIVREIADGNLSLEVTLNQNDKSSLLYSINKMRQTLSNIIISTNIVMADTAKGDLSSRMEGKYKGDFIELQKGINTSLDTINETLQEVMNVTNAISKGDLKQKIIGDYSGTFGKTKDSVNQTVDVLNKLVDEIENIVHSGADCGDFSVKMTINDKLGYEKELAELINKLFETTEESLADVLRVAEALAKGNLTQIITNDYVGAFAATKAGINTTVDNLRVLIGEIQSSGEVIASAASQIAAGNDDLARRTETQASSLQETAASMEELSTTIQQNTDNAKHANKLAEGASEIAKKGVVVVSDVVKTMSTINESSHKIVDIITVIDDIAFQTNILALNAAVEAARAGESGKGFAVVAVEVRNLAQRAANAAGEIKRLIDASVEDISSGSKQVTQAGKTMEDIVGAIQNVTSIMSNITIASLEQNAGINQVHQAITQMDGVTQENATLVEEAATAANSLKDQTHNLALEIAKFKI